MVRPQPTTELFMGFKMDDALMDGWFYDSSTTHSWIIVGFQMDGAHLWVNELWFIHNP